MSLERVIRIIEGFGLRRIEAEVYLYLAKKGPLSAEEVATVFNLSKQRLYPIIKKLQNKGVVHAESVDPVVFRAIVFEKALDLLVRANIEQAKAIEEIREELLSSWQDKTNQYDTLSMFKYDFYFFSIDKFFRINVAIQLVKRIVSNGTSAE